MTYRNVYGPDRVLVDKIDLRKALKRLVPDRLAETMRFQEEQIRRLQIRVGGAAAKAKPAPRKLSKEELLNAILGQREQLEKLGARVKAIEEKHGE